MLLRSVNFVPFVIVVPCRRPGRFLSRASPLPFPAVALEGCSPGPRRCRSLPSPWKVVVQGLAVVIRRHSLSAVILNLFQNLPLVSFRC